MIKNNSIKELSEILKESDSVLLFPHINMDGDCLGSTVALCSALRNLGKKAYVLVEDKNVPTNLDFLDTDNYITWDTEIFKKTDLAVIVDASDISRIPKRKAAFNKASKTMVIDHHSVTNDDNSNSDVDYYRTETDAAACGEIIYLLIKEMGCEITLDIANAIFTAITTDTGNFQHANTNKRSHEIAAKLYDTEGFNSKPISALLYERNSFSKIKLENKMIMEASIIADGRAIIGKITKDMLDDSGCSLEDTEGFVQKLMSIDGVEVGALIKEDTNNHTRVSLRTKKGANVARIALKHNGGGHIKAAGCRLTNNIEETEKIISEDMIEELNAN